jgi:hypothetical protein
MDLGIEGETVSEESNNGESESESETIGTNVDGWKGVTLGDKKSKNAGPQFNLLPHGELMDYFSFISSLV